MTVASEPGLPLGPQQVPPWWTDPTENVKALADTIKDRIDAAMRRQDDLRERDAAHAREMREMARMYEGRLDVKDQLIRKSEADRIDAIQTRSDLTVQRAAEVQAAQQEALAKQVATTADTFRASIATELAPIKAALAEVQRAQYETQGQKQQVVETRAGGEDPRSIAAEQRAISAEALARAAQLRANITIVIAVVAVVLPLLLLYASKK